MTTLRYAMLSALLSPRSPDSRESTPTAAAQDWLQSQIHDTALVQDFRLFDEAIRGLNASVEVEVKQTEEWREARVALEFAQGAWTVTGFEWID